MRIYAVALLSVALGCGCDQNDESKPIAENSVISASRAAGYEVGFVGVRNVVDADSLHDHPGLTVVETTVGFPLHAHDAEVFAWEFYARSLKPVKFLMVRLTADEIELVGESPMTIPMKIGINFFELPEPIPVRVTDKIALLQPEEGSVPFRLVRNWKTLITSRRFERPFMSRDTFSMYGWRYAFRAYWRRTKSISTE